MLHHQKACHDIFHCVVCVAGKIGMKTIDHVKVVILQSLLLSCNNIYIYSDHYTTQADQRNHLTIHVNYKLQIVLEYNCWTMDIFIENPISQLNTSRP